ncbi:hypothetical protein JKI95_05040 [Corynebacterium aquatimens]|uniref:hypothetical protein n=1 Tax=Corynebacterium TaxID=1716 RepID=UPI001F2E81E6|nr:MULTISPECIES: hypothetical protein [Corynebacterium]QYH20277.1 hypothetical protein JKI95_05040 [Corynebacterium aquatimens]UIZ92455.1 hypothetical protein JZY91_01195 [Corynebacterium sp. CNCTC7651]
MAQTSVTREAGEAARDAALAVPGVAGLHGGRVGEVALLLPGARIEGLRPARRGETLGLEIHVVYDVDSDREIMAVAEDVRSAVAAAGEFAFVDVVVADAVRSSAASTEQ